MAEDTRNLASAGKTTDPGPFLAKVISHHDKNYMGILEVQLYRESGNDEAAEGQLQQARYLSPFYGVTSVDYVSDAEDTYNNTQKSYGMWMIPPDVGTTVMVIYVKGEGYFWIGCVLDDKKNFMMPGYASTYYNVDESKVTDKERVPVAEFNSVIGAETLDATTITKPATPQEVVLNDQGLLEDDIRGITSSSARRETPSAVFGISTPGPLDKQDGAKTGDTGKREYRNQNTFVSRLGGSSFVMDDGDDKFLRKTTASEGPPEYARVENRETDGDPTLLHNELIRLRTRTGHQILLHNTEDLIYIGNARGTAWVELTSDGKIDIFSEDSISVRTKQDLNFYADRDINIECGRNFNTKVGGEKHTHVIEDQILIVDGNQKIHVKLDVDKTYEQNYTHHVKQDVNKLYDQNYLQHVLADVDKKFDGSLKTTVGAAEDRAVANAVTISSGAGYTITASDAFEVNASTANIDAPSAIHLNSGNFGGSAAAEAAEASEAALPQRLKLHKLSDESGEYVETSIPPSIMRRVPTFEPYPYHENLDPLKVKPAETDRDLDSRYEDTDGEQLSDQSDFSETMIEPGEYWKTYTTIEDTFIRFAGPADPEDDNTGE
jgi:hypothetical protein